MHRLLSALALPLSLSLSQAASAQAPVKDINEPASVRCIMMKPAGDYTSPARYLVTKGGAFQVFDRNESIIQDRGSVRFTGVSHLATAGRYGYFHINNARLEDVLAALGSCHYPKSND